MASMVLKPLGAEVNLGTNTTVSNSQLVRIINPTAAQIVLHFGNGSSSNSEFANLTIIANNDLVIQKAPLDILWANSLILAVPVAWKS